MFHATLKYAVMSDKKINVIADVVRGMNAHDALQKLSVMPHKAAKVLYKLVKSAIANAEQKGATTKDLHISIVDVSKGPKLKRMRFVGRARIHRYVKYRSFVRVVLDFV